MSWPSGIENPRSSSLAVPDPNSQSTCSESRSQPFKINHRAAPPKAQHTSGFNDPHSYSPSLDSTHLSFFPACRQPAALLLDISKLAPPSSVQNALGSIAYKLSSSAPELRDTLTTSKGSLPQSQSSKDTRQAAPPSTQNTFSINTSSHSLATNLSGNLWSSLGIPPQSQPPNSAKLVVPLGENNAQGICNLSASSLPYPVLSAKENPPLSQPPQLTKQAAPPGARTAPTVNTSQPFNLVPMLSRPGSSSYGILSHYQPFQFHKPAPQPEPDSTFGSHMSNKSGPQAGISSMGHMLGPLPSEIAQPAPPPTPHDISYGCSPDLSLPDPACLSNSCLPLPQSSEPSKPTAARLTKPSGFVTSHFHSLESLMPDLSSFSNDGLPKLQPSQVSGKAAAPKAHNASGFNSHCIYSLNPNLLNLISSKGNPLRSQPSQIKPAALPRLQLGAILHTPHSYILPDPVSVSTGVARWSQQPQLIRPALLAGPPVISGCNTSYSSSLACELPNPVPAKSSVPGKQPSQLSALVPPPPRPTNPTTFNPPYSNSFTLNLQASVSSAKSSVSLQQPTQFLRPAAAAAAAHAAAATSTLLNTCRFNAPNSYNAVLNLQAHVSSPNANLPVFQPSQLTKQATDTWTQRMRGSRAPAYKQVNQEVQSLQVEVANLKNNLKTMKDVAADTQRSLQAHEAGSTFISHQQQIVMFEVLDQEYVVTRRLGVAERQLQDTTHRLVISGGS